MECAALQSALNVMIVDITQENLAFFTALASEARLRMVERLAQGDCNVKELSESLACSSAVATKHVRILEEAGIIHTHMEKKDGAIQKTCTLLHTEYRLQTPHSILPIRERHEVSIPVGHFTDCCIEPTCGLASEKDYIGYFDLPRCFLEPERVNAQILWFSRGFVEYKFPNYVNSHQEALEIEISAELSSEAPGFNDNWPSDIAFILNGTELCRWTSPGDFGSRHGVLTPDWWEVNQYGLLKTVRVTREGVFLDGVRSGGTVCIGTLDLTRDYWTLRFAVPDDAKNIGGLTLFGEKFGNYSQNIVVRTYYKSAGKATTENSSI